MVEENEKEAVDAEKEKGVEKGKVAPHYYDL